MPKSEFHRFPKDIHVLYTSDYAMVPPDEDVKPAQGGFLVLRPNHTIYNDIVAIVREGDFNEGTGWGNQTGIFWGCKTFQGLIPYYFIFKNPGHAVELNWCIHNNMASSPVEDFVRPGASKAKCFTNQESCENCQKRPIEDIYSAHFTVCQKPWMCIPHLKKSGSSPLCRQLNHAWYQVRSELEKSWGRSGTGKGMAWEDGSHFYGYCHEHWEDGYEPIQPTHSKTEKTTIIEAA